MYARIFRANSSLWEFVSYKIHPKQFPSDDELFAYNLGLRTDDELNLELLKNIKQGTLVSVKGRL